MRVECSSDPQIPKTLLIGVTGSLDTVGSEKFMAELATRVISESSSLLIDMTGVDWVSSAGVGALVRLLTRTQSHQGGYAMFGCNPRVRQVLRICGLEAALNVSDTADQARARVRDLLGG